MECVEGGNIKTTNTKNQKNSRKQREFNRNVCKVFVNKIEKKMENHLLLLSEDIRKTMGKVDGHQFDKRIVYFSDRNLTRKS